MDESAINVIKGGETCIQISLRRDDAGLRISTKVHPRVENFLRTQADNNKVNLRTMTKIWRPLRDPAGVDKVLFAYVGGERFGNIALPDGTWYNVDQVGQPLLLNTGAGQTLNLSFLRLVGVSEDEGVAFTIRGVHSIEGMKNLKTLMTNAARQFYIDFLRPVNLSVTVLTQESRG